MARYQYVVLQHDQAYRIPALKTANPDIKVLLYKNASATYDYAQANGTDWATFPSGVGYVDADRNHPEWFLTDTSGNRIEFSDYPKLWLMDFGDPAYQQAWLDSVVTEVRAEGWDGVMLDDVNGNQRFHLGGRTIAKYPTYADQQRAMTDFVKVVGPGLTSRGILALPNIAVEWPEVAGGTFSEWIAYMSGAVQEYFSKWGTGTTQHFVDAEWSWRQGFMTATQASGKIFLGLTYAPSSDLRSMTYSRANFLIDWNGGPSAVMLDPGATDPWNEAWTVDIGEPVGGKVAVDGAFKRSYTGGVVALNPTSLTKTVSLGGSYVAADGTTVSSVTLAAGTGAVLRNAASATPTPTPAPTTEPAPTTSPAPTPADTTAPAVTITNPTANARMALRFTASANATDAVGVTSVVFELDGRTVCTDQTSPYTCEVSPRRGTRTLTVKASDAAGNVGRVSVSFRADRNGTTSSATTTTTTTTTTAPPPPPPATPTSSDAVKPTVWVISPANGDAVPRSFTVTAGAGDDVGVTKVVFVLDGRVVCTVVRSPWRCAMRVSRGSHSITVRAYDAAGNVGTASISVRR